MAGLYKIRRASKGDKVEACSLTVPLEIAEQLDPELRFSVEYTDEGILYRPRLGDKNTIKIPDWVKEAGGE